jgi:diguanylate cyclase (GGDEF)-like protein
MKKKTDASLSSQSLGNKLRVAFSLMSILPLLVSFYLVANYIIPRAGWKFDIVIFMTISILIAFSGFFVIKEVIDRVVSVSGQVKMIAAGDMDRKVDVKLKDEIGELSEALNQITQRVRTNMEELQVYGKQTDDMNTQIQRRLLVLASVLQITSLISQRESLDKILQMIVEKSKLLAHSDLAYWLVQDPAGTVFSMSKVFGADVDGLMDVKFPLPDALFLDFTHKDNVLIIDAGHQANPEQSAVLEEKLKLRNTIAIPVHLAGDIVGIIGIGNRAENFSYSKDDLALFDVFAKQATIAMGNERLLRKVEKLEIKDNLTGLYNQAYILNHLREEIKRAMMFQRPCAFMLISIDRFEKLLTAVGPEQVNGIIKKIASLIRDSVREVDRVARYEKNSFAVVLPEKNKREMQKMAVMIKESIESNFVSNLDHRKLLTVSVGTSENPLDGSNAEELVKGAQTMLTLV